MNIDAYDYGFTAGGLVEIKIIIKSENNEDNRKLTEVKKKLDSFGKGGTSSDLTDNNGLLALVIRTTAR
ncbi:MAG: hypothetical protein ABIG40_03170 [Parcubacteria group bacterium]